MRIFGVVTNTPIREVFLMFALRYVVIGEMSPFFARVRPRIVNEFIDQFVVNIHYFTTATITTIINVILFFVVVVLLVSCPGYRGYAKDFHFATISLLPIVRLSKQSPSLS